MRTLLALLATLSPFLSAADRPNILWITAEDMSPVLGCYGDAVAITPHIDGLAQEGIRYTHAFATAPVCSPVRSVLINGVYAPSQGTHQMRSNFTIPETMNGWPTRLREAGYYTSNNVKTDYNSALYEAITESAWNESSAQAHWRGRQADGDQPFFSVFNLMTSHQSRAMVWPYQKFQEEIQSKIPVPSVHDPETIPLPSYYVDTPVVRRTQARFYDCVTAMDQEVGTLLGQLEEDGLADNTIVFFYSDHGSGMPRHKRALLDSGMHVPLIVRFPKALAHLAPGQPGETSDRLVSFVDFGASVLSLLELPVPTHMQAEPFLGKAATAPRSYVFGHRDRVDEVIDLARSVRSQRYLYIRNYMPHLGYNQPTAWPDLGEIRHEFYRLADEQNMTAPQWHFAGPTRPLEELYDCQADPENLVNLAEAPEHSGTLHELRDALQKHMLGINDLGFWPEAEAWQRQSDQPVLEALSEQPLVRLEKAAASVGKADADQIAAQLTDEHPAVRYWGAVAASARLDQSERERELLLKALRDSSAPVRIEAAHALLRKAPTAPAIECLDQELQGNNLAAVLQAARTVELLGDRASDLEETIKAVLVRADTIRPPDLSPVVVLSGDRDMAMFIAFSARAWLARKDQKGPQER